MKKLLSYLTGMVLLAVTLPGSLYADRVDFLVNDDGSVAQQTHPRIAVAGDGSFVIVWSDKRNGGTDIFLQRYDSDGFPVSANRQVNDDMVAAHQAEPAIAADLSGLYSLVWTDYRNGTYPFDPDVFFQRYDSAVTPVGVNRNLTTELPDSLKETPDIALSPWGGGMVVWADYRNRNWDIYGQLISSDGSTIGANFRVNNDVGSSQQHAPRVAVSPEGWYAVTWYDNRNGHDDIYAQLYDSLANTIAVNVRVNSDGGSARQAFPDVATDGAGHFSVVWVDWRNGTYPSNPDIFARKFNTALVPMTSDKRLNTDGTFRAQREPSIAADRRGNLAMIWADSTGGSSSWDIVGQMMDFDGVIREANFRANSHADSAQLQPDVAVDGRYRYITWVDKRNGNFDIYASITKYNDPTLIPAPQSLKYEMLVGESVPAAQTVVVEHAGYNPLSFSTSLSHDWLAIAPTSGTTPDTVSVSIATDTLAFGTYFGEVKLIDNATGDSSVVISVRLDVTAPILELSADTVVIPVFAGVDDSVAATVDITNGGGGVLNWNLAESADWLSLSTTSGTNDSTVTLWANAVDLLAGNHATPLEVDAGEVMNS
ncbi:MAG: hypothetical protein KKA42_14240, partial [candidate division Zixibacteria bacterium]|nr:hypothetical protein [candidate division Zixibacteria bacterium]